MTTKAITLHYGAFVGICQICFKDNKRFGTLVDPNGHSWLICKDCINALWEEKQALNQDERFKEAALDRMMDRLRKVLEEDE